MHQQTLRLFLLTMSIFILFTPLPPHATSAINTQALAEVDPNRIQTRIEQLVSFGSRVSGTLGHNQSANWIASLLETWNYTTIFEPVYVEDLGVMSFNVIAFKPGNSSRIFGLSAHLDSISSRDSNSSAPGANDNGSGVGCLLETAYIIANHTFHDTIIFYFFTGEEQSFDGSERWIENHPSNISQISLLMNFDMVGTGDQLEIDWHRDLPPSQHAAFLIENASIAYGLPTLYVQGVTTTTPWVASDQRSFWDVGVGAVLIKSRQASLDERYHTSQDLPIYLNISLISDSVRLAISAVSEIANGSYVPPPFTLVGIPTLIEVSIVLGIAVAVLVTILTLRRRRKVAGLTTVS
jgi:hypothetical protein